MPNTLRSSQPARYAAGMLLLGFFLRAIIVMRESLWRDEIDAIRFAYEPLTGGTLSQIGTAFNGPLYHLMLRVWLDLTGVNDFSLRYFSVCFGLLTLALVFALARRIGGTRVANISLVLAALSPVLIYYSAEGKMYSLQPALSLFALYALLRATTQGARCAPWWLAFSLSVIALLGVHILAPLILGVAAVFLLTLGRVALRAHWRGMLITAAVFALPAVPVLLTQFTRFLQGGNIGHEYRTLTEMSTSLLFNWVLGLNGAAPTLGFLSGGALDVLRWACVIGALLLALIGAMSTRKIAHAVLLLAWLTLPMLFIFVISQRLPVFQPRYVLWSAPALYVLMAFGIRALTRVRALAVGLIGLCAMVFVLSFAGQTATPIRWDLRSAVTRIRADIKPGDAIIFQIPIARYSFEYYLRPRSRDDLHLYEGPYVNGGVDDAELDVTLGAIRDKHARVWLLQTERELWDLDGETEIWFRNNMQTTEFAEYHGASVALFER